MSYCELPDWYEDKEVVARKTHTCIECRVPIHKGEKHLVYKGNWPNVEGFETGRQHLLCRDACVYIRDEYNGGECIGFGQLLEFWSEHANPKGNTTKPWFARQKQFRSLMAKILWRQYKEL